MTNPVFVAVDTADLARAENLVRQLSGLVGGIKLGLQFWNAHGPAGVRQVRAALGSERLFLDLKLHDIPHTVRGAVESLAPLGVDLLTVHAAGGRDMMRAAKDAAGPDVQVVGVTVLTSMAEPDLEDIGIDDSAELQVARLADLSRTAGLDGIVCSPLEVEQRRAAWPDGVFVVPGIRPEGAAMDDQKRAMPPRAALEAGATILVIGRPITSAADPAAAARAIAQSLA
ncbi:orotidine-5'-phosphate decarboxylase [Pacificimonas flava]|uniref:Orotidine 5'-phosphate decarboxylase n=2 Tax=Pacificimonas TaxID=1960290 RepID=A0A219B1M7_9SPHN|nr:MULTISPECIES: orotidine-5'-phosphate decarboxylase [Pacificimonas]MBZ6378280.1 orotidine-5'-phosphate decarboxylase [Pacificimonas aurantium]OWV32104.1 orotidine-5'-phosphate decarboxylase [Pacificimonas flava]